VTHGRTDGPAVNAADGLLADRYRLRSRLGAGAMGVVWLALDERLQRLVAVKQLWPGVGLDPAESERSRQRVMREGRIAARLRHPSAITVHDVAEHNGQPVLIMEYFPSRSLAAVVAEQGPLAPATAARIGAQAAAALAAAHAAGIVHRDVKPGNLLVGDDGTVKIADFGISHAVDDVSVTQVGVVGGTPAFMAPETARGYEPTAESDIFSLGSTLYTAVEGTPPFGGDTDNALAMLHRVAAGNVPPPHQAGPLVPVLMAMLHPDPDQRPVAGQVTSALQAVADGRAIALATVAPGGGRSATGRGALRRNRPCDTGPEPARHPVEQPARYGAGRQVGVSPMVLAGHSGCACRGGDRGDPAHRHSAQFDVSRSAVRDQHHYRGRGAGSCHADAGRLGLLRVAARQP
jgi:hypothetical protein